MNSEITSAVHKTDSEILTCIHKVPFATMICRIRFNLNI